jgi:deoxyribodipyrimidine photo-lyase
VVTNLGRLTAQEKLLIAPLHVTEDVISILPSWGNFDSAAATLQKLKNHQEYAQLHDFPEHQTTLLSAHLKFGTLSIRQVYQHLAHLFGPQHPLIRQLYWRDFFTHIAYHAPHVFGHPFNPQYAELSWNVSSDAFERWCTGTTGFPLVDAGMRQLLETGYMHNRVRMVTASFLVKDLSIDWRCGERYFAQQLIDYDPALNNGNWQWVASTGCDSQPYFRIFNPWLQQKKFDPACTYIKQYVPELRQLSARQIHTWYTQEARGNSYPIPMLDHSNAAKATLAAYKKVVRKK